MVTTENLWKRFVTNIREVKKQRSVIVKDNRPYYNVGLEPFVFMTVSDRCF